jgi:hypothetical protein
MNIDVINLAQYEAPQIVESKQKEWVTFGDNNSYFQFLIDRYRKSATNMSIINNVTRLMYGKGLGVIDASRKPSEYAQVMAIFNKNCLRKLCFDLKTLGQCVIQVHYSDDHKKILKAFHMDMNLVAMEKCDEYGQINGYYYSDNWEDIKKFPPKRYSAFGSSKDKIEILCIKPYSVGMKYFSTPDYVAGTAYALLEEEVSDYLINTVQKRFSGTKVVNFNNGVPDIEVQNLLQSQVKSKLTGSKGESVIVAFNNNKETATTIDDIPLNDAPEHYQFLATECEKKIMVSHSITSGLLLGLGSANGFGSNADELKNAFVLFDNMVIRPLQQLLLDGLEQILNYNGNTAKLFFRTLQPLEFTDLENVTTNEEKQEETGTELSAQENEDDKVAQALIDKGEDMPSNWVLIDSYEVDYENDDLEDAEIEALNNKKPSLLSQVYNFVSTGTANPRAKSEQDAKVDGIKFMVRYSYEGGLKDNSREFCRKMVGASKLYRKEDIIRMGSLSVNKGWGPKGADTYSIWLYKGGGACHHKWMRKTFVAFDEKSGIDPLSPKAKTISTGKAEKAGYRVRNPNLVAMRPIDMPNQGFLPK